MLELFIIIHITTKHIVPLAKKRGLSPTKWVLMVLAAWFGAELLVSIMMASTIIMLGFIVNLSAQAANYLFIASYILAIIAAGCSAEFVKRRLVAKPLASAEAKYQYTGSILQ